MTRELAAGSTELGRSKGKCRAARRAFARVCELNNAPSACPHTNRFWRNALQELSPIGVGACRGVLYAVFAKDIGGTIDKYGV